MSLNAQQDYAYNQSEGAITLPVNSSYVQAYAEFLGITEPVNLSWIQAICVHFGITEPLYGSWVIALANYYGITEPLNGSWWYAIGQAGPPTPTDLIWNLVSTEWQNETTPWATIALPTSPLYFGPNSFTGNDPVLTGTADPNNYVAITIDSKTYLTQADGLGDWSQQVGPLLGGADPGTPYQMSLVGKDSTTGLESDPTLDTIDIIKTDVVITFELNTGWSIYWYTNGIQVEKEVTPGVWEAQEYEGNPTWNNGANFYKVIPYYTGQIQSGYSAVNIISRQQDDNQTSVQNDPVFRDIVLAAGFNYRIVGVPSTAGAQYAQYVNYTVYQGANILFPKYQTTGSIEWALGYVQQTFTL